MAGREPIYRLADLRAELEELDAKIAADAKKRRRLAAAVAALEALAGPKKKLILKPVILGAVTKPAPVPPPGKMQIHEAAALVLQEAGKALNASEILEQINRRGLVGRQLGRTSVVSALDRKFHNGELFDKPQPGIYALVSENGAAK